MRVFLATCIFAMTFTASLPALAASPGESAVKPMLINRCDDGSGGSDPQLRRENTFRPGTFRAIPVAGATKVIGRDPATVRSNFAGLIEANFNLAPETLVDRLSDKELSAIARHYSETKSLADSPLMKTLATRLSDRSLLRLTRSLGSDPVREAVDTYASKEIRASFSAQLATARPGEFVASPAAAPTMDMTLEEIYLEFRTAPVGSVGPAAAIAETSMYAGLYVGAAWKGGSIVGAQINDIITEYDPSLGDTIGGTIAGMVDASQGAASELEQGHFETAYDQLFDYPVTNSGGGEADYDIAAPMEDWYDGGGGCGW